MRVALYEVFVRSEQSSTMHMLVQRLACLASSRLHAKNSATADLVTLISNHESSHGRDAAAIKKQVGAMLKRGHVWDEIIGLCDKLSGVVLILGKGYL